MNTIKIREHARYTELALSRPERSNAFNALMIQELTQALDNIASTSAKALLIHGEGKHFCAGADLQWMKDTANFSAEQNKADAIALANLFHRLNTMPMPTIAACHGAIFGGGIGLLAACDIVVSSEQATFCLSEVKIGLAPATIAPFVIAAIGKRQMRRYALTAERFNPQRAHEIGLVHELVSPDQLHNFSHQLAHTISCNAPQAVAKTKQLIFDLESAENPKELTSELIAQIRTSEEGQHGLSSFINRSAPRWEADND